MVIQTGNVALASYNRVQSSRYESVSYGGWEKSVIEATNKSADSTATDGAQIDVKNSDKQDKTNNSITAAGSDALSQVRAASIPAAKDTPGEFIENTLSDTEKIEAKSLQRLLDMMGREVKVKKMTVSDLFHSLFDRIKERAAKLLYGINGHEGTGENFIETPAAGGSAEYAPYSMLEGIPQSVRNVNVSITKMTETVEETSFVSSGSVKTQDGREIEFNLSFSQSRRFCESTNVEFDFTEVYYMDPLVINCSDDVAEVSDQSFYFDLDCDGEEDNIALLGKACGFLALDRNEDGIINDGSELFGAKTGDGFKELAVFDLDGNGWIDENDEVFNRLKIWKRHEDGTSELVGLGVAGIGAIYLQSTETGMSMQSEAGNPLAALRQTGIYLREDGTAGTIQHVDLAKIA